MRALVHEGASILLTNAIGTTEAMPTNADKHRRPTPASQAPPYGTRIQSLVCMNIPQATETPMACSLERHRHVTFFTAHLKAEGPAPRVADADANLVLSFCRLLKSLREEDATRAAAHISDAVRVAYEPRFSQDPKAGVSAN